MPTPGMDDTNIHTDLADLGYESWTQFLWSLDEDQDQFPSLVNSLLDLAADIDALDSIQNMLDMRKAGYRSVK